MPNAGRHHATLLGAARELCCADCEAVARTLAAAGLESCYERRCLGADRQGTEAALMIDGVRCAAALWRVEQTLRRLPGVTRAHVNPTTERAQVAWDPAATGLAEIVEALRQAGYDGYPYDRARQEETERRERRVASWRVFVAAIGALQVLMLAFPRYMHNGGLPLEAESLIRWASLLITAPVIAIAGAPFFHGARLEITQCRLGLDTPIALALGGALAASAWATLTGQGAAYFECLAMLAVLALGARYLESEARRRAARQLDPAPLEPIPAERRAAIARLAERAPASKPRRVENAEHAARHLTWVIVLTAGVAALSLDNFSIAVAVLVAACPWALALASPAVLARASGALLARGVLLTRARALEALERATDVVFDKTGTLTTGRVRVRKSILLGEADEEECLRLAAALEASSHHPIARAFAPCAAAKLEEARSAPGEGLEGCIDGRRMRIGTERFCREGFALPAAGLPGAPRTRVFLASEEDWLAAFELEDELRPEAEPLIARLKARGLEVHLASGDAPDAVAAMARRLRIARYAGGMRPSDKFDYLARLQGAGRVVAMVGDGLNDARVLARADVSVAMVSGADAAEPQEADVILTPGAFATLDAVPALASRAMCLVRQNLRWAMTYNALALPLAAAGFIGPWEAALAMGASATAVLLNGLRPLEGRRTWKAFPAASYA